MSDATNEPPIPKPTIFLRNKFFIKPGLQGRFFDGQREILVHTKTLQDAPLKLRLVAACGQQRLIQGKPAPEPLPPMMHLWELRAWDSLYEAMYDFSETDWYSAEVQSLQSEHQDLLVGAGQGIELSPRPRWLDQWTAGYEYLYEEIQLNAGTTKLSHLRQLNWLIEQVKERGCYLQWIGGGITGIPAQICLLWRAKDVSTIEKALVDMAYEPEFATRYADMMLDVRALSRTYMYPESTERIDDEIPARADGRTRPSAHNEEFTGV